MDAYDAIWTNDAGEEIPVKLREFRMGWWWFDYRGVNRDFDPPIPVTIPGAAPKDRIRAYKEGEDSGGIGK